MPIQGIGWEIHIQRQNVQHNGSKARTVGHYRVYHNGVAANGPDMSGMTAECAGPGNNSVAGSAKRILPGRYPLWTQAGTKYVTFNYRTDATYPRPGIELKDTGNRKEILIHPGIGFLASIGCINLCTNLPHAGEPITFASSRRRVIAAIDDLLAFAGAEAPRQNGRPIPNAWAVIDREP